MRGHLAIGQAVVCMLTLVLDHLVCGVPSLLTETSRPSLGNSAATMFVVALASWSHVFLPTHLFLNDWDPPALEAG